jgi:hypothetical protein
MRIHRIPHVLPVRAAPPQAGDALRPRTSEYCEPCAAGLACALGMAPQIDDDEVVDKEAGHASLQHVSPILTPGTETAAHQDITRANGPLLPTSSAFATSELLSRYTFYKNTPVLLQVEFIFLE